MKLDEFGMKTFNELSEDDIIEVIDMAEEYHMSMTLEGIDEKLPFMARVEDKVNSLGVMKVKEVGGFRRYVLCEYDEWRYIR